MHTDRLMLGANHAPAATTFRVWTTKHERCELELEGVAMPMVADGNGERSLRIPGDLAGARYRFVLDGTPVRDPFARWLPDGVDGLAQVVSPRYAWRHPAVARPLREQVVYELHVGTFTPGGTYAAAMARLPALAQLGVTTLELMPLAAFAGARGWGYDGVAHLAPHAAYGTPDELRAFIDAAHGHGLAVIHDVVYNHFGPAGNVLREYSDDYFTHEVQTAWGDAPNFRNRWMRAYVLESARTWLEDYRFDGLRFDALHAIADPEIVRDLVAVARRASHAVTLFAEDDRNDPRIVREVGMDAIWADDFHHVVHATLTGERDGYYASYRPGPDELARAIDRGWIYEGQTFPLTGRPRGAPATGLPAEALVYCLQNHDQIGNRALGDRLSAQVSLDAYCAASALLLFLPMTPLLFMGQEWAASTPFQFFTDHAPELGRLITEGRRAEFARFAAFAHGAVPDPQAEETFARSVLRWDERAHGGHARVLALYEALLRLRREDPVLRHAPRAALAARCVDGLLVVSRWRAGERRTLVVNLGDEARPLPVAGARVFATSAAAGDLPPHAAVIVAEAADAKGSAG